MRRVFVGLFLVVFLVSSVFFNVSSAVSSPSVTSEPQDKTGIDIKQMSLNPLKLKITIDPSSDDLLYQVWGQDASGWTLVSAYSENSVVTWNPKEKKDGIYYVQVRIKDKATDKFIDQKMDMIVVHDPNVLRIEKVITDAEIDGHGTVGQNINVKVIASGTKNKDIRYSFTVKQGKKWVVRQNFTKSNLFVWKPSDPGTFALQVDILDINDPTGTQCDTIDKPFEIKADDYTYPEFRKLDVTQVGKSGNYRIATESTPRGEYKSNYMFTIGEQYRKPQIVNGYKTSDKYTWNSPKSGIYEVSAYIKDISSTNFDDAFRTSTYKVETKDVTGVSLDSVELSHPDRVQNINTTMKFTARGSGGNELLYAFYRHEAKGIVVLQDYSTNNILSWKPDSAGKYTILVRIKDIKSGSYEAEDRFTYTILDRSIPQVTIDTINVEGGFKVGKAQKITVNASGNDKLMYKIGIQHDNFDWVTLQNYSPSNTCMWIPKQARDYKIIVYVKDLSSGSHIASYTKEIVVSK
ncbi:hypothetical protein [Pseudobacteroides cellulosolvens]|uniref:Two component regulator three Y domain-containing protein n=1 Tax=Pseudobacteroides cellulosolvens ATCC 35603 = DSM 2933 TaxID=398512 RepID=A0A0L6JLE5_9FIRM|nr:hypothetical protein [Pseudobacteroides cellulosolvens]KNY26578.1 Two component regulator three Y domain-containing protein [Pseudobacteroides cellulosolvens ATCC 35603 = DSM 2933]